MLTIKIEDPNGTGFANQGTIALDAVYVKTFEELPWPRLPMQGEVIPVSGNWIDVRLVVFELDGQTTLYLDAEGDCPAWRAKLLEQGFELVLDT